LYLNLSYELAPSPIYKQAMTGPSPFKAFKQGCYAVHAVNAGQTKLI